MKKINAAVLVVLIAIALLSNQAFSQTTAVQRQKIDSLFSTWNKPNSPGMELMVLHKGSVILDRAYGSANVEKQIPNSSNHRIWIASMSKQFTGLSVLLLAVKQQLNMEDDIRKYLPELPFLGDTIRVKHLLYHTSGLREGFTLTAMSFKDESQYSNDNVLKYLSMQKGRNFKPGERFEYNNSGYVLLAIIIERVSKISFPDFTSRYIFKPLRMDQSSFVKSFPASDSGIAIGYSVTSDAEKREFKPANFKGNSYGSTGLMTTAADLAKYDRIFYKPVFGKKVQELQLQRGRLNNGQYIPYAAGLEIETFRGKIAMSHSGSDAGYKSEMIRFPGEHFTVICLANTEDAYNLTDRLFKIAALFIKLQKTTVNNYKTFCKPAEAAYINKTNMSAMRFTRTSQGLQIATSPQGWYQKLLPEKECSFKVEDIVIDHYKFIGPVIHYTTRADHAAFHLIKTSSPAAAEIKMLAGAYYSDELKATYDFFEKDGSLFLKFFGIYDVPLTAYEGDLYVCDFIGTNIIHFVKDNTGGIVGMEFNRDGIYKLQFLRQ